MQREIAKAEYLIALTSNAVTEEVRNNYFLYVIENKDNGFKVFESIVETIIASMNQQLITAEDAYQLIQNEYNCTNCTHLCRGYGRE